MAEPEPEASIITFHVEGEETRENSRNNTATEEVANSPSNMTAAQSALPGSTPSGAPAASPSPPPEHATDVDYEAAGHGFVHAKATETLTLTKAGAAQLRRQLSAELRQAREQGVAMVEIKTDDADSTSAKGEGIWSISMAELAAKFPNTGLNIADPKASAGLSSARAEQLLHQHGKNILAPPKQTPEIIKFLKQFADPLMLLLVAAAILALAVAYPIDPDETINLYLGVVLIVLVLFTAAFSYFQEGSASDVMKSFTSMLSPQARVWRDGKLTVVPATDIVVGDILLVSGGDVVPADMRVIWTQGCKVETSSLTGESLPITVSTKSGGADKLELAKNVCFNSSKAVEGECWGVVFATGNDSLIGKIATLAGTTSGEETPLQKEMTRFVKLITIVALVQATIFFIIGGARGMDWLDAFINVFIVVTIANVPQGLPITVVSQLTVTAKKMAARKVLVKQLQGVETLGSITCIASDKTGTLTQNKMTVSNLWFDRQLYSSATVQLNHPAQHTIGPSSKKPQQAQPNDDDPHATLALLERIAALCSKTRFADERQLTPEQAHQLEKMQLLQQLSSSHSSTLTLGTRAAFPTLAAQLDPQLTVRSGRNKLLQSLMGEMLDDLSREVIGDASETALFNFVRERHSIELLRYHWPTVYSLPFNSRNKYAITIVRPTKSGQLGLEPGQRLLLMKGAPEIIVSRCSSYLYRGKTLPIDERFRAEFDSSYTNLGSRGERVLGFAMLPLPKDKFPAELDSEYSAKPELVPNEGLVFVGLMSLVDPPKLSVPQAVLDCHRAGIKVIMVTGDHPLTAAAIARQVNIFEAGSLTRDEVAALKGIPVEQVDDDDVDCVVVKGTDMDAFSEEDWSYVLNKPNIVFARTTPTQKLAIVERLQAMGHVVAVTGDGVNDSPALKRADIGCAMGISGSDVARDAADVIIMDDDFSSLVVGIKYGRTIFDNIIKTIAYTLTHALPELAPILLSVALGFPLAMSSFMILSVDLFTELAPAISIAYEPSESDIMAKPPRNPKTDRLASPQLLFYMYLQAGVIETFFCFLGFFLVMEYYGMHINALFNTPYFHEDPDRHMPVFPGCKTLADSPPFRTGTVCYSAEEQKEVLWQAQTCYYAMLIMAQVFHIWLCKTRTASIFTHGFFRNEFTLPAVAVEICLLLLFILPPSSRDVIFTIPFPPRFWALLVLAPTVLFIWQEGRKYWVRRHPNSFVAKYLHW